MPVNRLNLVERRSLENAHPHLHESVEGLLLVFNAAKHDSRSWFVKTWKSVSKYSVASNKLMLHLPIPQRMAARCSYSQLLFAISWPDSKHNDGIALLIAMYLHG